MASEKAQSYRDLLIWKKSHELVIQIYHLTKSFPGEEMFGLTSQVRRSAVSIPANIAEGFGRIGKKDKLRFFNIAASSLNETDYYLLLSNEPGYIKDTRLMDKVDEIGKMLKSYMRAIGE